MTVPNGLRDPGWHQPSEPCFAHLCLPCWDVRDHRSPQECSEQVLSVCLASFLWGQSLRTHLADVSKIKGVATATLPLASSAWESGLDGRGWGGGDATCGGLSPRWGQVWMVTELPFPDKAAGEGRKGWGWGC